MPSKIPSSPRWSRANGAARALMQNHQINWLPIDIFSVFEKIKPKNWILCTGEQGRSCYPEYNWDEFYKEKIDAETFKRKGVYIIIYNETQPIKRIYWTIAHEIGHILIGHLDDFDKTRVYRNGLTESEYHVLEQEAHAFAAELLSPFVPLYRTKVIETDDIQRLCNISKDAADRRHDSIEKRQQIPLTEIRFYERLFADFLSPAISICSNTSNAIPFAHLAQSRKQRGMKKMAKVHFAEIDPYTMRITACPVCGNKHFSDRALFCKMCGTPLYNDCVNEHEYDRECGAHNDGDARYCERCGSETVFFSRGVLSSWEELQKEFGSVNTIQENDESDIGIFGPDIPPEDDIPF